MNEQANDQEQEQENGVAQHTWNIEAARQLVERLIAWGVDPKVRLFVLLAAGVVAWLLVFLSFPLEDAVPRNADF